MKISRHRDGSRATEITSDVNDNSVLNLHGDAVITTENPNTNEKSTVANISQHGAVDFVQRPRVADEEVALKSETGVDISTTERTIVDNVNTIIALCPAQPLVTVLYSFENVGADEKGTITISEHNGNYLVTTEQHALEGYFADVEFTATENNGSLLLNVIGQGTGQITQFKYRVNTVNTLYL
ncbi:MAG: hypothetical protein GY928_36485 [Colwellia sp.]|nr:hypothetical protein [Colwellia sp.]